MLPAAPPLLSALNSSPPQAYAERSASPNDAEIHCRIDADYVGPVDEARTSGQAPRVRWALLLVLSVISVAGCSDESESGGSGGQGGASCAGDTFSAGLQKTGKSGKLTVTLESADPAPPQKGDNRWTIRVTDPAGAAISDATVTVTPFMPEHGHGTSVQAVVTPKSDGRYELFPVNLLMPGKWEITLDVGLPGGQSDSVVYTFCVEG
ncbi:MAG: hypothetical protein AMXMBFR56_10860 [Polyangiaceae bacterium]